MTLTPGTILHAETQRPYQVAHADDDRQIILDFGQHEGMPLREVEDTYLRWMVAQGKAFLPDELRRAAAVVLAMRQNETEQERIVVPDLRDIDAILTWAEDAPAGDVADVIRHLAYLEYQLTAILDDRAAPTFLRLISETTC